MKKLLLILGIFAVNHSSFSQNFGCYDNPGNESQLPSGVLAPRTAYYDFDYLFGFGYNRKFAEDGYYKVYASDTFVVAEGLVIDGMEEGAWIYYEIIHGNFSHDLKTGIWKAYEINADGDTTKYLQTCFENDTVVDDNLQYGYNNNLIRKTHYENGLKHGLDVEFDYDGDTLKISNYKYGKLDGLVVESYKGNMVSFGTYTEGKKNGKFVNYRHNESREFRNDTLCGLVDNQFIFKNHLPYTLLEDSCGFHKYSGTLFEGNGTLTQFYDNGKPASQCDYKDGLPVGKYRSYYSDGTLFEKVDFGKSSVDLQLQSVFLTDINIFILRQIKFEGGTKGEVYTKTGEIEMKYESMYVDSLCDYVMVYRHLNDGNKKTETFYRRQKMGIQKYYYNDGTLKASINYNRGEEIGFQYYYTETGELIRTKFIAPDGSNYSVFKGDTVNVTDSKHLKQGKWVGLESFVCSEVPISTEYYKDDKPVGVWTYGSEELFVKFEKGKRYEWLNPRLVHFAGNPDYDDIYHRNYVDGYLIDSWIKVGEWKIYDYDSKKIKKGKDDYKYLSQTGMYEMGKRVGLWRFYNERGKLIKEVDYGEFQ